MDHFYLNIPGWFDYHGIYRAAINATPDGGHVVEVGCFKGCSSSYLAVEIANSGKTIQFDCVDHFQGSPEHQAGGVVEDGDVVAGRLQEVFVENMRPVENFYNIKAMNSVDAAATYADASLDFVFIDAAHEYEDVIADLQAWLPKVKSGGIFAGHDIHHPPVQQAVSELIPNYSHENPCWVYRVP